MQQNQYTELQEDLAIAIAIFRFLKQDWDSGPMVNAVNSFPVTN